MNQIDLARYPTVVLIDAILEIQKIEGGWSITRKSRGFLETRSRAYLVYRIYRTFTS